MNDSPYRHQKWFIGFSDLSTFHFPLSLRSGWATVHGPNLMELGAGNLDLTTRALWDIVESPRGNQVTQHASSAYQVEENQWGVATDAGFNLTQPTQWKMLNNETECVAFSGRLIGGCPRYHLPPGRNRMGKFAAVYSSVW
ncbi:LD-carboxypeptidase [Kluyvera cryocrescens]|uniref:LD-carboxypeptidase n=1 Tax=Kluyvera cryocrescens TaxID=580 RepID=A0A485CT12_KLUCR|nr:LD-carboxypeptidase [Kluyvera cryocrescens]